MLYAHGVEGKRPSCGSNTMEILAILLLDMLRNADIKGVDLTRKVMLDVFRAKGHNPVEVALVAFALEQDGAIGATGDFLHLTAKGQAAAKVCAEIIDTNEANGA